MQTIQACVNPRLLTKADRLFTGTLDGRVIELLQNARRAGATQVTITNHDGWVTVKDNGRGVDDFAHLLNLGGSGWDGILENSEDPAGVGIFCLAPREVTIRSRGKRVTIKKGGWTHEAVNVVDDPDPVHSGTILHFPDDTWDRELAGRRAVFSSLRVSVDGTQCASESFVSDQAAALPKLGCRIEVRESEHLGAWHKTLLHEGWHQHNVLVNFHGQAVAFNHHPVSEHGLHFLVDLTGAPTGIRLMLPARTRLVENEAYQQLLAVLELEAYRYLQRRGEHTLPYKEYVRAQKLGVRLPEASPSFSVGLLSSGESPEPVEVTKPKDFPLSRCYRIGSSGEGSDSDETNAHLLAALGTLAEPFVPVSIRSCYDGYSWAKLPTITRVELQTGAVLHSEWLWAGKLSCVDSLRLTVHTSDQSVFTSPVCLARAPEPPADNPGWADDHMLVTPAAQEHLSTEGTWYHLGGWSEEGDTYETQLYAFERDLADFWANLIGPEERLRRSILDALSAVNHTWQFIKVFASGEVRIRMRDHSTKTLLPPGKAS